MHIDKKKVYNNLLNLRINLEKLYILLFDLHFVLAQSEYEIP